MEVGIESIHGYCGELALDIKTLFEARGLDLTRFSNLLMEKKSVALPCEDPVTYAVNAAKPLIDELAPADKDRIELVITASESGLDFGKSLSTYVHSYLCLSPHCRLFEIKQACYAGTAALQMAAHWVASNVSPGAKALVIATDIARAAARGTYSEPSQGVGAVALVVSAKPEILTLDMGATGYHSYEVMDTCRPEFQLELGDPDLSLLSYLDCAEKCYQAYSQTVAGADLQKTFNYLAFHTPFGGMVKGAHRRLMRKFTGATTAEIEADFEQRVRPSFKYCVQVGNIYSATLYLALCGLIDSIELTAPKRIGLFSYGSGCSSEFFSGILKPTAKSKLTHLNMGQAVAGRLDIDMATYEKILNLDLEWMFGIKDKVVDTSCFADIYQKQFAGKNKLVLDRIENYHRIYRWS